ncbi:MAG: hypothetical protein FWE16_00120 [Firmicutes bacterium]|nr:hypothetical protein [Bacillota bacterium]
MSDQQQYDEYSLFERKSAMDRFSGIQNLFSFYKDFAGVSSSDDKRLDNRGGGLVLQNALAKIDDGETSGYGMKGTEMYGFIYPEGTTGYDKINRKDQSPSVPVEMTRGSINPYANETAWEKTTGKEYKEKLRQVVEDLYGSTGSSSSPFAVGFATENEMLLYAKLKSDMNYAHATRDVQRHKELKEVHAQVIEEMTGEYMYLFKIGRDKANERLQKYPKIFEDIIMKPQHELQGSKVIDQAYAENAAMDREKAEKKQAEDQAHLESVYDTAHRENEYLDHLTGTKKELEAPTLKNMARRVFKSSQVKEEKEDINTEIAKIKGTERDS